MTTILNDELLTRIAVYWPPGALDEDGEQAVGTPVERACHWDSRREEMIDDQGKVFHSKATVYMKQSVVAGGWLWLSSATIADDAGTALAEAPASPPDKQKIMAVDRKTDMDNLESLYVGIL